VLTSGSFLAAYEIPICHCIFAALVASSFAMDQPSFHTRGTPTVDAEKLASRLRLSPAFAQKVADEITPGTTVIVTDTPAVRKPAIDATYFAAN
jgi:hypothetical protein